MSCIGICKLVGDQFENYSPYKSMILEDEREGVGNQILLSLNSLCTFRC